MRFVEFCSGIGGLRTGLQMAGWHCVLSIDNDPDAVDVHRRVHGDCFLADISQITATSLPDLDAIVAGFPCQPFSSSGHRTGFSHGSGTVFDEILRLAEAAAPPFIVLENVRGLLSNRNGHTMARVLGGLAALGYLVAWAVIDAAWFGVMQSRPRVFILAVPPNRTPLDSDLFGESRLEMASDKHPLLSKLAKTHRIKLSEATTGSLQDVIMQTERRIGRSVTSRTPFRHAGFALKDRFVTCEMTVESPSLTGNGLGDIVCPGFDYRADVRSVRYWGHSGRTEVYLKKEPISHSIGTSIGASPLFAVHQEKIRTSSALINLLEFSNWDRSQDGLHIFRINPARGALLFGKGSDSLAEGLSRSSILQTKQYVMVGNLVAPPVAEFVANCLDLANGQR